MFTKRNIFSLALVCVFCVALMQINSNQGDSAGPLVQKSSQPTNTSVVQKKDKVVRYEELSEEVPIETFTDTLDKFFTDVFLFHNKEAIYDSVSGWDFAYDTTYKVVARNGISDTTSRIVYMVRSANQYDSLDLPGTQIQVDKDTVLGFFVALREYPKISQKFAVDPNADYEFNVFRHLQKDSLWTTDTNNLRRVYLQRVSKQ